MSLTILLASFTSRPFDPDCRPLIAGVVKRARSVDDVERVIFAAGRDDILEAIEALAPDFVVALPHARAVRAEDVIRLIEALRADASVEIAALCHALDKDEDEVADAMKVVLDRHDNALFYSRARTLCLRGIATKIRYLDDHGLYACRRSTLARLHQDDARPSDAVSCLETLSLPALGMKMRVVEARAWAGRRPH